MDWTSRKRNVDPTLVIGIVFTSIGVVFAIVGGIFTWNTLRFLPGTVSTQGTIVSCVESNDAEGSNGCQPIVSFQTSSGQHMTFQSSVNSTAFAQGDAVAVRYHPNDPGNARIDSWWVTWLLPSIFTGIGLLLLLIGLAALLQRRRRKMSEERVHF